MKLIKTENDNITLDIAKKHIYVDFNDDDTIIDLYIKASLGVVEDYIHGIVLEQTYETTQSEAQSLELAGWAMVMPVAPYSVIVTVAGHDYELPQDSWYWNRKVLTISPASKNVIIEKVTAIAGRKTDRPQITQARLLLIGDYYAYRNNNVDMMIRELPTGIKMILGNCTGVSL